MTSKNIVNSLSAFLAKFIRDEAGAEAVESALVIGMIAVVCMVAMKEVGPKINVRWTDIFNAQ